jgi:hypothetical protein
LKRVDFPTFGRPMIATKGCDIEVDPKCRFLHYGTQKAKLIGSMKRIR